MLSFVSEGAHQAEALAFANALWFREAISKYVRTKSTGLSEQNQDLVLRIRAAVREEISVHRHFVRECSEMTDCVLFAPRSAGTEPPARETWLSSTPRHGRLIQSPPSRRGRKEHKSAHLDTLARRRAWCERILERSME